MTEVRSSPAVLHGTPAPAYIGPLLREDAVFAALWRRDRVVLVIAGDSRRARPVVRHAGAAAAFRARRICGRLSGGRGPALLASVLTPLLATLWFTDWPHDGPPTQWIAHVVFFLLIAVLSSLLMHELQKRSRAEREALAIAAEPRARRCAKPTGARTSSSPCWRTSCAIRSRRSATWPMCLPRAAGSRRRSAARAR